MKPSWDEAPDWAKCLVQEPDGGWWWYAEEPVALIAGWYHYADACSFASQDNQNSKWRLTLEQKPQGD